MHKPEANAIPTSESVLQILVVEDEILIRMVLAETLRNAGFQVIEASDGDEAQRVLCNVSGIHLIITDIQMPGGMNGLALARWARRQLPDIKIAVVSANVHTYAPQDVDMIFEKPFDVDRILAEVQRLVPGSEQPDA